MSGSASPAFSLDAATLLRWSGPDTFRQAKEWQQKGFVTEARRDGLLLRGVVQIAGKKWRGGLKISGRDEVTNLCGCIESRRGLICAHSVAIALALVASPPSARAEPSATPVPSGPSTSRRSAPVASAPETPGAVGDWQVLIEGSLREIQAEVQWSGQQTEDKAGALQLFWEACQAEGWALAQDRAVLRGEREILRFFAATLPKWEAQWSIVLGPRFRYVTRDVVRLRPQVALAEAGEGWLDFRLHYTAEAQAVLSAEDLRRLLAGGQAAVSLADGRRAVVDTEALAEWEVVLQECDPQRMGQGWRVPARFAGYLEETARVLAAGGTVKDLRAARPGGAEAPGNWKPGPLFAQLRPYQQTGTRWLAACHQAGVGGLLADEMGLGKTVQTLALLETLPGRSLVVCPASLVWNWAREAARFCPQLPVCVLTGPERMQRWQRAPSAGLFLTSYGILRREVERLAEVSWSTVVLDEGQHIKNPASQNARSVFRLRAQSRIVLSGTPLENALGDLWSIYRFLLPGYLGSRQDFQERYERPLAVSPATPSAAVEYHRTWARLRRKLQPYLLRRRKADLLPELPPKIEQVVEVPLGPRQRQAYDQLQAAARAQLAEMQGGEHGAAGRMKVLTALLRLRQCCCDVRLLTELGQGREEAEDEAEEGKLAALLELLGEAVSGGSRVLVFSQFAAMLDLIEPALVRRKWEFVRLDGTTRHRAQVVEKFQAADGPPIFLISLKAGGVGLNLTAADTVIHYDPWWNPSVEAQATDRAHRLGQQRVVTSIKLIAAETVEQRVLHLQERKRTLGTSALDAETAWQALTDEEMAELLA